MSKHCCAADAAPFDGQSTQYRRALLLVIAINAIMFVVEIGMSHLAQSLALRADALDFLADALSYALSLYVIGMSLRHRAWAALCKAASLLLISATILGSSLARLDAGYTPNALQVGLTGVLALAANLSCLMLLLKFRDGDANVRSVWLCTRNDAAGNAAVMASAALVAWLGSAWPDLVVALVLAGLFFHSAVSITRQAWTELQGTLEGTDN